MKTFFLALTLIILLFPIPLLAAAGSAMGINCSENKDCASGDCEDSDIMAADDDFCVCGKPKDCEDAYGKEQGETWECTNEDDDESYGLHYCLSNTRGKQNPFTVGQLAKEKKEQEGGEKQMPYPVVPPKIQVSLPTLQPFQTQMVTPGEDISLPWLAEYIIAIYRYAIIIGSVLAVLVILIGGVLYLTAGGIPSNVKTAQSLIFGSIFGLVLLLCSHLILNTINPNLTKLGALSIETVKAEVLTEGEETSDVVFHNESKGPDCFLNTFGQNEAEVKAKLKSVKLLNRTYYVHEKMAPALQAAANQVASVNYSINSGWSHVWRQNVNNPKSLSLHSFAIAIDINPKQNPNYKRPDSEVCKKSPCTNPCKTDIPQEVIQSLLNNGFRWGGQFRKVCDAMHFEWLGPCKDGGVSGSSAAPSTPVPSQPTSSESLGCCIMNGSQLENITEADCNADPAAISWTEGSCP